MSGFWPRVIIVAVTIAIEQTYNYTSVGSFIDASLLFLSTYL